jgi:ornithine carbamoyltransferase
MHLTELLPMNIEQIEKILDLSAEIKANQDKYSNSLTGKKLYMLFQKTSTRTALSFGLGMEELGGTYFMQRYMDSNFCVGEIRDEIRFVARNVDIALARLKHNKEVVEMERCSPIPIINGCCDTFHPSQALADMLTIRELFGSYKAKVLYIGVWNNVLNSLVATLPRLGGELQVISPLKNDASLRPTYMDFAEGSTKVKVHGHEKLNSKEIVDIVNDVDFIYLDTWIDMEFFHEPSYQPEKERRIKIMEPFKLTQDLLKSARAKVLHDMPIHPGYEIERPVIEDHIETILHQAENRRHTAKGILHYLLNL